MEQHRQRHQFRQTERRATLAFLLPGSQQALFPFRLKNLEKIIDQAKQLR